MYKLLILPLEKKISQYANWVIIPDGILYYLPFEALLKNPIEKLDKTAPFLIKSSDSLAISYSPAWKITQQTKSEENKISEPRKIKYFTYESKQGGFPYSQGEKKVIEELDKSGKYKVEVFKCSKEALLTQWRKADGDIIHLSLHGKTDSSDYYNQKIWLDAARKEPLYAYEIGNNLGRADLVILSACETAIGKIAPGEGVFSLTRGFFQGGAKQVMAALWEVSNGTNVEIISNYYNTNNYSSNKILALSRAKRQYLAKDRLPKHPKYWAGMILID